MDLPCYEVIDNIAERIQGDCSRYQHKANEGLEKAFRDFGNEGGFAGAGRIAPVTFQKSPISMRLASQRSAKIIFRPWRVMPQYLKRSVANHRIKPLFNGGLFFDRKV